MKTIYIPGIPDVKMRPRMTKRGHTYDPNAEKKEASIQKAQFSGDTKIYTGALFVDFLFVFPRPKGHFGTGKNAGALKASAPEYCCNNKDFDNLEKFYADSFNSISYVDDRQVVENHTRIVWAEKGEVPHVAIEIFPLEDIDQK